EKSGVRGIVAAGKRQTRETRGSKRSYVDAVSVVVKRDLIHQPRVNDVRGMNHAAVGRVAKDVSDGRHIVTAPLTIGKGLGDLLGNKVPEHRELAREVVVYTDYLFFQVRRCVRAAKEPVPRGRLRENARSNQGGSIWIDHARGNLVTGERLTP